MLLVIMFFILHSLISFDTSTNVPKHIAVTTNVVRIEILRRFGWLVKERKHEERNSARKNPLKGKNITSHIYTHKNIKIIIQKQNNL